MNSQKMRRSISEDLTNSGPETPDLFSDVGPAAFSQQMRDLRSHGEGESYQPTGNEWNYACLGLIVFAVVVVGGSVLFQHI